MTSDRVARTPYPGLRAFRRDESYLFFGRKTCTQAMVERLADTHFLSVVGSSGTGKSSLVNTGLIESLELGFMAQAGSNWRIVHFRPEGKPIGNLARGMLLCRKAARQDKTAIDELDVNRLASRLLNNRGSLVDWCVDNIPRDGNLLIIVDQFEELFRYQDFAGRDEAETFVARLLDIRRSAIRGGGDAAKNERELAKAKIYLTVTMRSEYLGACSLIPGLAQAITEGMFLTPRMERKECEEAIRAPAAVCRIKINDDLVNRVLNDLSDFSSFDDSGLETNSDDITGWDDQLSRLARRADQLPLMQHALNRLWEDAKEKGGPIELTLEDYEAIGGVTGALDKHANAILAQLENELGKTHALAVTEAVFRAVTTGTTAADAVRRPTQYGKLVEICGGDAAGVHEVVKAFGAEGRNFLTVSAKLDFDNPKIDDDAIVDISHESLIRQWLKLGEWVRAEARTAESYRDLERAAKRWNEGKASYLSHRDLDNIIEPPNEAWALRYGDSYKLTMGFLAGSRRRYRQKIVGVVAAAVAAVLFVDGFWELAKVNFLKNVDKTAELVDAQLNTGVMTNGTALDVLKPFDAFTGTVEQYILQAMPRSLTSEAAHAVVHLFDVRAQTELNIGNAVEAEKYANEELKFATLLVSRTPQGEPDWPEYALDQGSAHERLGDAYRAEGKQTDALDQYRQYGTGLEELEGVFGSSSQCDDPDSPECTKFIERLHEYQLDRWESLERIGDLQKDAGKLDLALAEYTKMAERASAFSKQWSSDPQWVRWKSGHWESFWHFHLATSYLNIGDVLAARGNKFSEATMSYESMQTEIAKVVAAAQLITPDDLIKDKVAISLSLENTEWVWTFALCMERLGDMDLVKGQYDEASAAYNRFSKIVMLLLSRDRATAQWKRADAVAKERLGDVILQRPLSDSDTIQGEAAKAEQLYYRDDNKIAAGLVEENSAYVIYQRDLSISNERLGDALLLEGNVDGALEAYKLYNAKSEELTSVKSDPNQSDFQRDKLLSYQRRGEAFRAKNQSADADAAFDNCGKMATDKVLKDYDPRNGLLERDAKSGTFHFVFVASKDIIQDYCRAQLDLSAVAGKPAAQ